MKSPLVRLIALGVGIAVVLSCDSSPVTAPIGAGIGSTNSGSSSSGSDRTAPTVTVDTPVVGGLANVGDSILVVMHLHDDRALGSLTLVGYKETGNANLGTFQRTARFTSISVPATGQFRAGLRDTIIRRYLQPAQPVDTSLDSLVIIASVADSAGNADSTVRRIDIVAGPRVALLAPAPGDSVPAGVGMTVTLHATHTQGVAKVTYHVVGETNWPTPLDTTVAQTYAPNNRDVTLTGIVRIPADAPIHGRVTVNASAVDVNGQTGAASPVSVVVRSGSNAEPRVTQSVLARSEISDSVGITANGDGIQMVGFVVLDSVGTQLKRDSVALTAPYASNVLYRMPLNLAPSTQGAKVFVYSFAKDQAGRVGYSIKAGTTAPQSLEAAAFTDSVLVAYGQTFALPRNGTVGDIAVDPVHGNVFVSNTNYNLLEVWNNQTHKFAANGVAVGALPWGMDISTNPNVLLVANSGGTNISRVDINTTDPNTITEDPSKRILTRNTAIYIVHESVAPKVDSLGDTTFIATEQLDPPKYYSDRPQYVEQGADGLIYYSTRPTATATPGTIRVLDPTQAVPDPRHIYQYASLTTDATQTVLFNLDYVNVIKAASGSGGSDQIDACDHTPGTASPTQCFIGSSIADVVAKLKAGVNSDVDAEVWPDVPSLALQDTTFVARSGDRTWIGFGEADTKGSAGRIIMAQDAPTFGGLNVSSAMPISDIMENASDVVTGLAIDSTGLTVGAHGSNQSYFASVPNYLHLRLQGTYDSQNQGAGIAFDPGASGYSSDGPDQLAFVASADGTIEIVDVAHYNNRGTLKLKYGLYGPLRATRPLPGDPSDVVLKLYGMTANGLVVINLRAADIKPAAP